MNPRIDEAALLAARAAGPNPPPLDRLKAAAEYAIERTGAPQLILFGSAARGEFTPESDFDFLAVAPLKLPGVAGKPERLEHPTTGDDIHVLLADVATIEAKRWIVGTVFCEAMSQGRTVGTIRPVGQVKGGMTLVKTQRDPGGEVDPMVKKTMEELTEAPVYAKHARTWLESADFLAGKPEPEWPVVCKHLQESSERALKAFHIGHRAEVVHIHDMREAWEKAEALGERFPVEKNDRLLDEMTLYGGSEGYGTPSRWDPKDLAEQFRPIAEALVEHAERRVPELMAEHERKRHGGPTSAT